MATDRSMDWRRGRQRSNENLASPLRRAGPIDRDYDQPRRDDAGGPPPPVDANKTRIKLQRSFDAHIRQRVEMASLRCHRRGIIRRCATVDSVADLRLIIALGAANVKLCAARGFSDKVLFAIESVGQRFRRRGRRCLLDQSTESHERAVFR